jgi:hypothetical protein
LPSERASLPEQPDTVSFSSPSSDNGRKELSNTLFACFVREQGVALPSVAKVVTETIKKDGWVSHAVLKMQRDRAAVVFFAE